MKHSIEWHKDCLKNSKESIARDRKEYTEWFRKKIELIDEMETYNKFREYQINEAIKEGKDSFDEDKYKIKREK